MRRKIETYAKEENILYYRLDNGLKVYFYHKPLFKKVYVSLKVKFGSVDKKFKLGEKSHTLPQGIAHFLEHKLFETEKGDAAILLSELGASPNAFTSNDLTAYIFSATNNFLEALSILLDFVFKPNFKEESVLRERGIIEQEIKMYLDNPDFVMNQRLLENMFETNSCRDDIGGTIESIKEINASLLTSCHSTFYRPDNMAIMVSGNFPLKETLKLIKEYQKVLKPSEKIALTRIYDIEKPVVVKNNDVIYENVNISKVGIGIKLKVWKKNNKQSLKREIALKFLFMLCFGETSNIYQELLENNYINDSFDFSFNFSKTFAYAVIETDSNDPKRTKEKLLSILYKICEFNIVKEEFLRLKKSLIGQSIRILDSLEALTNQFLKYENNDYNLFLRRQILEELTIEDLDVVKKEIKKRNITSLLVLPNSK